MPEPKKPSLSAFWLGAIMAIVGFAGWWMNWQSALNDGHYRPITAVVTPLIGFLGLAFLVSPLPEDQFVAKYGKDALGRRMVRLRASQILAVAGLVAGLANFLAMKGV